VDLTEITAAARLTLARALIQRLEPTRSRFGLLTNPSWTPVDRLVARCSISSVSRPEETRKPELRTSTTFLPDYEAGRIASVIVDEAQLIEVDAVSGARLPAELPDRRRSWCHLLLLGSPELGVKVPASQPPSSNQPALSPQHARRQAHGELHRASLRWPVS